MNLNGCHNRPRPTAETKHIVQDGYFEAPATRTQPFMRVPRYVEIPHVMTTECQYTKTTPDPRCAGCVHEARGGLKNV